jgi:hypothetical protein
MSAQLFPMFRPGGRFATPEEMAIEQMRRAQVDWERRIRSERQAKAHETLTKPEALWDVLQRLDVEDGIEFAKVLHMAIVEKDTAVLAMLVTKVAHEDAREAIP